MGVTILPSPVGRISEFFAGFTGTCGETALSVALCAAAGTVVTEQYMVDLTHEMINHSWASANGASAIGGLANEARLRGFSITNYGYSEPFNVDWHAMLIQWAGVKPIVLEFANGQALHDVETGSGENAVNLHYHYICIVGKQDDGYICADGDNFQVLSRFQIYSYGVLQAAQPCAMIIVEMNRSASGGGTHVGLPAGWTDDGKALHAPSVTTTVKMGFRDWVLAHPWDAADVPLTGEYGDGHGGTLQDFRWTRLGWTSAKGVYVAADTRGIADGLRASLKVVTDNVTTLTNQNIALAAANTGLKTQIDTLNQKVAADATEIAQLKQVKPEDPRDKEARGILDEIVAYTQGK
ncbi:MAG: hypothetical protein ACXWQ5_00100 [Ktedonobacterales bacterium]